MYLKPYLLVFFLAALFNLAACGQTGDLYLPEEDAESKKEQVKK